MYELKIAMLKNGKPEEFLMIAKNFNTTIDGTGTTYVSGRINYIRTMFCGEYLQKIDELARKKWHNKCPLEVHPGGFTRVFISD